MPRVANQKDGLIIYLHEQGRYLCCRTHGDKCGVTFEIQSISITRSKEKSDLRKEINGEMAEWTKALPC